RSTDRCSRGATVTGTSLGAVLACTGVSVPWLPHPLSATSNPAPRTNAPTRNVMIMILDKCVREMDQILEGKRTGNPTSNRDDHEHRHDAGSLQAQNPRAPRTGWGGNHLGGGLRRE